MKRFVFALFALACAHNPLLADCAGGAYFSGIAGVDFLHLQENSVAELKMDTGFVLGATIGYQFCSGFALEGELAYRRQNVSKLRVGNFRMLVDGELEDFDGLDIRADGLSEVTTIMANLMYRLDFIQFCLPYVGVIVPYVGIGLGYAHAHELVCFDFPTVIFGVHGTDNTFACQSIIGLSTAISSCMDLGIEYRCLTHHKDTYNQSVNLMVKQYF